MRVFLVGTNWFSSPSLFFPYIPSMGRAWISVHLLKIPVQGRSQPSTKPGRQASLFLEGPSQGGALWLRQGGPVFLPSQSAPLPMKKRRAEQGTEQKCFLSVSWESAIHHAGFLPTAQALGLVWKELQQRIRNGRDGGD